jgi:uncharacterized protein (TIGR04255 family)
MGAPLAAPPLVEAICEFRLAPGSAWDWAIPGLLWERLQADYPTRKQLFEQVIVVGTAASSSPSVPTPMPPIERLQFFSTDESRLVQVGPNLLAINQVRAYPGWDEFRRRILAVVSAYSGLAAPTTVARIGLRYINRLPLPTDGKVRLEDWLTLMPTFPPVLERPLSGFMQRYELREDGMKGRLSLTMGLNVGVAGSAQEGLGLVLDLDGHTEAPPKFIDSEIGAWLDKTHDRIGEAFLASLQPKILDQLRRG